MKVFDFKISTWERIRIPDDISDEELLEILKTVNSPNDLLDKFPNATVERLEETDEYMDIGDVQDMYTQEVMKDYKQIWNNLNK